LQKITLKIIGFLLQVPVVMMASVTRVFRIIARIVHMTIGTTGPNAFMMTGIDTKIGIVLFKLNGIPVFGGMTFPATVFGKHIDVSRAYTYCRSFFATVTSGTICRNFLSEITTMMTVVTTYIVSAG
jgi:hypothetical protein